MQLTAKLTQLLPIQTGTGKNGEWKKQDIIVETDGQYPKKVCISLWGDKIDQSNLQVNDSVTASIDVESREYNSRWYTEVRAWKVEKAGANGGGAPYNAGGNPVPPVTTFTEDESDDLPF